MSGHMKNKPGSVSFKLDDIHDAASRLELVKIVACVNCKEIPIRPIMSCENGHIVCSACRTTSGRCLQCASTNVHTRNRVAENVVMSFVFKCKNRSEGCAKLVPWPDLLQHLNQECHFRPVPCDESLREVCNGKLIPYASYVAHLRDCHGIRKFKTISSVNRSLHCNSISSNCRWPLFIILYDDQIFILNVRLESSSMYVWVTKFSSEPSEHDYTATVSVVKVPNVMEVKVTFPVLTFRRSFDEIRKQGYFLCLQRDQLLAYSSENVRDLTDRQVYNYSWIIQTEISKLE